MLLKNYYSSYSAAKFSYQPDHGFSSFMYWNTKSWYCRCISPLAAETPEQEITVYNFILWRWLSFSQWCPSSFCETKWHGLGGPVCSGDDCYVAHVRGESNCSMNIAGTCTGNPDVIVVLERVYGIFIGVCVLNLTENIFLYHCFLVIRSLEG